MILLNPGPVTLSDAVRAALSGPDLCHREPEFATLQADIRRRLLASYHLGEQNWAAALLTGSGTAAVEAMLSSLVPTQGKLLVCENGVYGERMRQIAERYNIEHVALSHAWQAPIDCARVAAILNAEPNITHVAAVHHETTTGRLNDLESLAACCREHGVEILLDAVSSFGAESNRFRSVAIGRVCRHRE